VQGRRQSAGDCQQGRLALCCARSGKPAHITGTGCAQEHATSEVLKALAVMMMMMIMTMSV